MATLYTNLSDKSKGKIVTFKNITIVLFFVGDDEESAMAGLGFDDFDDAVMCAMDNGFSQIWEAEFDINPSTVLLAKELEYDEEGYLVTDTEY